MNVQKFPTVSVPICTYNSSRYIIETLESIRIQNYPNIELVISDDNSSDNTIPLCNLWIENNRSVFTAIHIVESKINTGPSANFNRAISACKGEWVKLIGHDDIMFPDCISQCVEYVSNNPEIKYLFANVEVFGDSSQLGAVKKYVDKCENNDIFSLSALEQSQYLVNNGNCLLAPTCFYNLPHERELNVSNDERIPFCDDYPKWITITRKGEKLFYLDKKIVRYRVHSESVSSSAKMNLIFYKSNLLSYIYYRFEEQYAENPNQALENLISEINLDSIIDNYTKLNERYQKVLSSKSYRLGKLLMTPVLFLKRIIL